MANESKTDIRNKFLRWRNGLKRNAAQTLSKRITARVLAMPEYQNAKTVFVYLSFNNEPSTDAIISDALEQHKKVAVPVVTGNGGMHAVEIDAHTPLIKHKFGMPERALDASRIVSPHDIDIIFVPGLAVTEKMDRIGHGGGYYDKYLKKTTGLKVLLAYEQQVTDWVPVESNDVKVDRIITQDRHIGAL